MRTAVLIASVLSGLALAKHGDGDKPSTSTPAAPACNPPQFANPSFESGVKSPWTTPTHNLLDRFPIPGEVVSSNPSFPTLKATDGSFWLQGQSGLTFAQTIDICNGTTFVDFRLRVRSNMNCEIWNNGYPVEQGKPVAGGWGFYIDATPSDPAWQVLDFTIATIGMSGQYSIQWDVGDCFSWEGWTFIDSAEIVAYR